MSDPTYELYYWNGLPGRGEVIRLIFAAAGAEYRDVARDPEDEGGGNQVVVAARRGALGGMLPYAPPILRHGELVLAQSAVIARYVGEREGLAPEDDAGKLATQQLFLSWGDLLTEAHDTHHPISTALFYEDQKDEALEAARRFLGTRMPSWLGYFEEILASSGGPWLLGKTFTYADLAAFNVLEGLRYAFPKSFAAQEDAWRRLGELRSAVAARPRIAAYLGSERAMAFNEDGIFRHYPELDRLPDE